MPRVVHVTHRTPPLTRHRPFDKPTRTARDPHSSSIGGRRASGFLQVSLSKVCRHGHRGARPTTWAETPPITLTTSRYRFSSDDGEASRGRIQRRLLRWISATRALTIRLIRAVGSDLSSGNWIVPFDVLKSARSSANRARTEPPGNRLT